MLPSWIPFPNSRTIALLSPVPANVGASMVVMLSMEIPPLSLPARRSGADRAAGCAASTVIVNAADDAGGEALQDTVREDADLVAGRVVRKVRRVALRRDREARQRRLVRLETD